MECFVCGGGEDGHGAGHKFWSVAAAAEEFARQPQGDAGVEARYVAEFRPY